MLGIDYEYALYPKIKISGHDTPLLKKFIATLPFFTGANRPYKWCPNEPPPYKSIADVMNRLYGKTK